MLNASSMLRISGIVAVGVALMASGCEDDREPKPTLPVTALAASAVSDEHGTHQGAVHTADPADWCGGHGLPESMCTKCNPGLVEGFQDSGDWCPEHGYPESACPSCNPMRLPSDGQAHEEHTAHPQKAGHTADPADWCAPHGLPESMCTVCHPSLVEGFQAAGDWCAEHGYPESACPFCNPMKPPPGVSSPSAIAPGTQIRFRSPAIEQAAGIEVVPASMDSMGIGVEMTFCRGVFWSWPSPRQYW